jgi:hypothetical protein
MRVNSNMEANKNPGSLLLAIWIMGCACHPERPAGWDEQSHGSAAPAYEYLFDDSAVRLLDIFISPKNHQAMQQDLEKYRQAPEGRMSRPSSPP